MNLNFDVGNWNWNEARAAGKHVASYVAGAVTFAVALHFFPSTATVDASAISDNVNSVINGLEQVAKGVAGLIALATPFYTMFKAAHNASPKAQAISLTTADPTGKTVVITSPEIARATPDNPNIISNTEAKVMIK